MQSVNLFWNYGQLRVLKRGALEQVRCLELRDILLFSNLGLHAPNTDACEVLPHSRKLIEAPMACTMLHEQ